MVYAIINMDNFGWGKTRAVVADDPEEAAAGETSESRNSQDVTPAANLSAVPVLEKRRSYSDTIGAPKAIASAPFQEKTHDYDEEAGRTTMATSRMREAF